MCLYVKVICTQPEDYNNREVLCDASGEGPLLRNPGNHDRARVPRIPTSPDVDFTVGLPLYETGPMDRFSNMSFRNVLEGRNLYTSQISYMLSPTIGDFFSILIHPNGVA